MYVCIPIVPISTEYCILVDHGMAYAYANAYSNNTLLEYLFGLILPDG
jgi:hypothetical protein